MNFVKCFDGFKLHQNTSLHQQIRCKFTHYNSVIMDLNAILLDNLQPRFAKFMSQRIFVDFFQKSIANVLPTV